MFSTAMSIVSSSVDVVLLFDLVLDESLVVYSHLGAFLEPRSSSSRTPRLQLLFFAAMLSVFLCTIIHVMFLCFFKIVGTKYFSNIFVDFQVAFPITFNLLNIINWLISWLPL